MLRQLQKARAARTSSVNMIANLAEREQRICDRFRPAELIDAAILKFAAPSGGF
jgi:hypothetical protein